MILRMLENTSTYIDILVEPMVSKNCFIWQPITAKGMEMMLTMR